MRHFAIVYGPAYLDRVVRVDAPLIDPKLGGTIDRSFDGRINLADRLELVDDTASRLIINLPDDWHGARGVIQLHGTLAGATPWTRRIGAVESVDDLGGMGAGFTKALQGRLVCALGVHDDTRMAIERLIDKYGIQYRTITIDDHPSDWTLLISSGAHGDKLAVGFRGCHAALAESMLPPVHELSQEREEPLALVVAGLPNTLAHSIFKAWTRYSEEARFSRFVRAFAPARRNVIDRIHPISMFAHLIDFLSCNADEWSELTDLDRVSLNGHVVCSIVTDGPRGAHLRYRSRESTMEITIPAFPRSRPPVDTNRAGEALAATLLQSVLDGVGVAPDEICIRDWARRASAAAALVLDYRDFRFPAPAEIERALAAGVVE